MPYASKSVRSSSGAARISLLLLLVGLAIVGALVLSWRDIFPGGWRLRALFESYTHRQAIADEQRITEHLARFKSEDPGVAPGSIVFLGSSIIERFPLAREYPGKPCVNRGIANLSARDLERILPECLPPVRISAAVLYTGAADWRASGRDAGVLAVRVDSVIRTLARLRPSVPVVLLGILPERHREPAAVEALRLANARLRDLSRERGITFVDTARPPIADGSGSLSEVLSVDDLHLNDEGYRILAGWIAAEGGAVGVLLSP